MLLVNGGDAGDEFSVGDGDFGDAHFLIVDGEDRFNGLAVEK